MDVWLDSQNLYRKNTALDGSCLFRAVSELLFSRHDTEHHLSLRKECVEFMAENQELFGPKVISTSFEEYLKNLSDPVYWAGELEIEAISLLYGVDFLLFKSVGLGPIEVTDHGFEKKLMLCYTPDNFYDAVFPKSYIENSAFCQSIVYGILYERVYQLNDIEYAVEKMLHDKSSRAQREKYLNNQSMKDGACPSDFYLEETEGPVVNTKELIDIGAILFPYKVAKALDPDIYRNIEFDNWVDALRVPKKGSFWYGNGGPLRVGVKCLLKFDDSQMFQAHVQEMSPDNGPVMVFVEQLGQKMTVPFDKLEPIPRMTQKPDWTYSHKHQIINKLSLTKSVCNELKQDINKKNKVNRMKKTKDSNNNCVNSSGKFHNNKYNKNQYNEYRRYEECSPDYDDDGLCDSTCEDSVVIAEPDSTTPSTPQPHLYSQPPPLPYSVYGNQSPVVYSQQAPPPQYVCLHNGPTTSRSVVPIVNIMAVKSVKEDFSDLPMSDMETLRFFFNLGIEYFRKGYMVWPQQPVPSSPSSTLEDSTRSIEQSSRSSSSHREEPLALPPLPTTSTPRASNKSGHKTAQRPPRFMKLENSEAKNQTGRFSTNHKQEDTDSLPSSSTSHQPVTPEHGPPPPPPALTLQTTCQPMYSYAPYSPMVPCPPTPVEVPHYQYRPVGYYEVQEIPVDHQHGYVDSPCCAHLPDQPYPVPYPMYPHPQTSYYYTN